MTMAELGLVTMKDSEQTLDTERTAQPLQVSYCECNDSDLF